MAPNDYDDDLDTEEEEEVETEEQKPKKKRATKKWKDPNKPKRAMSAFFIYSQVNRQKIKETNPDASFGDVARILADKYKNLSEKEMKKYKDKAAADKVRYEREMEHYVPMEDPTEVGGRKKKAKKDPNAPKKNMSAYFLYSVNIRSKIKDQNPDASFGDIARLISEKFKNLSEKERKIWDEKAAADKERYQRQMAVFRGN